LSQGQLRLAKAGRSLVQRELLMIYTPLIDRLINALRCLPGVGPKSAQRMAFHVLERNRNGGMQLSKLLSEAIERVGHCKRCHNLSETELCQICSNPKRDQSLLCILESPADVIAVEQTAAFHGLYFVLMGHLSPIDGIGPSDIGIDQLQKRFNSTTISELILATNPTVEGEATAHYIAEIAKQHQIKTSRIAYGVPVGGELEFVDGGTLTRSIVGRKAF